MGKHESAKAEEIKSSIISYLVGAKYLIEKLEIENKLDSYLNPKRKERTFDFDICSYLTKIKCKIEEAKALPFSLGDSLAVLEASSQLLNRDYERIR